MKQHNLKHQQGATLLLTFVFMLGMLAMVGLALDAGHILVNKTRLQNALDAAALSAAINLHGPGNNNTTDAIAKSNAANAGIDTFNEFIGATGNNELAGVILTAANFSFSDRVNKFSLGLGGTPNFVKVISNSDFNDDLELDSFFIQVVTGKAKESVGAVSTAGPIGQNCDLVPLVICADTDPVTGVMDKDCDDDTNGDTFNDCYGYNMHEETELHAPEFCKPSDPPECVDDSLESGNFTLLTFDSPGGNTINAALEGTTNTCEVDVKLDTAPGLKAGPVRSGINTRIANDTVTNTYDHISHPTASNPAYNQYLLDQANPNNLGGIVNNRVVAVPVGDCSGIQNGISTFDFATDGSGNMAAMCVLIRRPVINAGQPDPNYVKNSIYIEMMEICPALGNVNPENPVIFGPFRIVLFKSEDSNNS